MRVKAVVLVAALAACSSSSNRMDATPPATGGSGGTPTGGSPPSSGGSGGAVDAAASSGGSGGIVSEQPDAATVSIDATAAADGPSAPPVAGGTVLYLAGDEPMSGNDGAIHEALQKRGLTVQDVTTKTITAAMAAEDKRLMIVSYSIQSGEFQTMSAAFIDAKFPIIVLEQNVLGYLGLTADNDTGHGYYGKTTLTMVGTDPELTAGLTGDVSPYGPQGKEMFWGVPGTGAIKVAVAKDEPAHVVYFAYPTGAMMASKPAPGKRMLLFIASHAPPPVKDRFINADGQKLLDAALDWMLK